MGKIGLGYILCRPGEAGHPTMDKEILFVENGGMMNMFEEFLHLYVDTVPLVMKSLLELVREIVRNKWNVLRPFVVTPEKNH
jgi:hypothetical protein